jgi:TetR/AcrR family transcriptional regulator, regulator of cefoperazone and chloramphenicol sensitivity
MSAVGEPAFEDLTARARIRDAAIRLFAERGIDGTTIRDVAGEAGVSGGLIRHHFGSKEELRDACDAYVLAQVMRIKEQAVLEGQLADASFISSAQPAMLMMLQYIARSMVDGSSSADDMFAEMVGLAERWLDDHHPHQMSDPAAYAALVVAMEIGVLVMREQLSNVLGSDIFERKGHLRLMRAKLEFYSSPLVSRELANGALGALDRLEQGARHQNHPRRQSGR